MEPKNRDPIKEVEKKPVTLRDVDKISLQRRVHLLHPPVALKTGGLSSMGGRLV